MKTDEKQKFEFSRLFAILAIAIAAASVIFSVISVFDWWDKAFDCCVYSLISEVIFKGLELLTKSRKKVLTAKSLCYALIVLMIAFLAFGISLGALLMKG